MLFRWMRLAALAVAFLVTEGAVAQAQTTPAPTGTYDFSFTGSNTASGVFQVTNGIVGMISGTFNYTSGNYGVGVGSGTIVGLTTDGDNRLFTDMINVDSSGIAFLGSNGSTYRLYSDPGTTGMFGNPPTEFFGTSNSSAGGDLTIEATPAPTPGAGGVSWLMTALLFGGWGVMRVKRKIID